MRLEVVVLQAKIYGQTFHLTLELRKDSYHVEFSIRRVNDGSGGCHCGRCFSDCFVVFPYDCVQLHDPHKHNQTSRLTFSDDIIDLIRTAASQENPRQAPGHK
jgi:hypothetical protein